MILDSGLHRNDAVLDFLGIIKRLPLKKVMWINAVSTLRRIPR